MQKKSRLLTSLFSAAVLASAALLPASASLAAAPMVKTQVPGFYRLMIGNIEVTALLDGTMGLEKGLLQHTNEKTLNRALDRTFVGNPTMHTAVNAYLINTGTQLVLVDAGAAGVFGPTLGKLLENMKAAGYQPEQVDHIVITHLHPDHVVGIINAQSQPVFPQATVHVAKTENDFWLSKEIASGAPKEMQPFFKMAQDSAAPYQASGRWKLLPGDGTGEVVPGIKAVDASGHTPGHRVYLIESEGQKLLMTGDVFHAHAIQFAEPGVSIKYDADPKKAIAARKELLKRVAAEKTLIAGSHLPFPGIGHVVTEGKNSYRWVPIEYTQLPPAAVNP